MLPLIAAGGALIVAGAISAARNSPSGSTARGVGDMVSSSGTKRSFARTARWAPLVDKLRGPVPRWLLLGHVSLESDGSPTSTSFLNERGLMQLMPQQSQDLGLDHNRMGDPAYSLAAGAKMYARYGRELAKLPWQAPDDMWRAAYYVFAIGAPARAFVAAAERPLSWSRVVEATRRRCAQSKCKPSVAKAVENNQSVWEFGHLIDERTRAAV